MNWLWAMLLYRVSINVAKNLMRKQRISSILRLTPLSQRNGPSENLLNLEIDRMVWSCISALPYKVQCVIILKYINDLSQEDIQIIAQRQIGLKTRK